MKTRKPKWKERAACLTLSGDKPERQCDHPDCAAPGEYRAPKSPDRLSEYHWFCMDHVRAYNAQWDYFGNMSNEDIEHVRRRDATWDRPSWPFGTHGHAHNGRATRSFTDWHSREQDLRDRFHETFDPDNDRSGSSCRQRHRDWSQSARRAPTRAEDHALSVLDLDYPVDLATVKARYKALVKKHHPDRHGGSPKAVEMLKAINLAYSTLKAALAS